jgi:hypothetical protein
LHNGRKLTSRVVQSCDAPLEVELNRGYRRCAADQRITFGRRVQRLWRIGEFTFDQATFAVVAYARTAGPADGNRARFGQLEQAAEAGVPWRGDTASQERHNGSAARGTVRTMRQGCRDSGDARCESGRRPKHFHVDPGLGNAPCHQAFLEILEKAGRATQVELGTLRNPDLLEQLRREMAWSIEVRPEHISRCRPACRPRSAGMPRAQRADRPPPWQMNGAPDHGLNAATKRAEASQRPSRPQHATLPASA